MTSDKEKKKVEERIKGLDNELYETGQGLKDDEINQKIAEYAKNVVQLAQAEREDQDVQEKKEQLASAREVYVHGRKINMARIAWLREILVARGKE